MYLTDISMQLVSMLFVLVIGLYFFMFVFTFYRREKRRTREQDVKRYTFEYCTKEMELLNKYTDNASNIFTNREDVIFAILNLFERLAVGVYTEVLSEEVVVRYFGSYMRSFYEDNRINLFEMRKSRNDAGLYANYEQFMEEWDFRQERLKSLNGRRVK